MTKHPEKKLAAHLEATAKRLRRGLVGDVRIIAALLDRAAVALRKVG